MSNKVSLNFIAKRILYLRDSKVLLDRDLANLYGVSTKRLNEQVKRNLKRFPKDFMFRLTKEEFQELVAICDRFSPLKHSTVLPYAFTEQGVAMLSSVLNSDRAISVNIAIMRTFVKLREMLSSHKELAFRLKELEGHVANHNKEIKAIFQIIQKLIDQPEKPPKKIGFI